MTLRSEKLRHLIATLPCMCCGQEGQNQAAHANFQSFGKWMGIKASDAALMALCVRCHAELDQGQTMMKESHQANHSGMRRLRQGRATGDMCKHFSQCVFSHFCVVLNLTTQPITL